MYPIHNTLPTQCSCAECIAGLLIPRAALPQSQCHLHLALVSRCSPIVTLYLGLSLCSVGMFIFLLSLLTFKLNPHTYIIKLNYYLTHNICFLYVVSNSLLMWCFVVFVNVKYNLLVRSNIVYFVFFNVCGLFRILSSTLYLFYSHCFLCISPLVPFTNWLPRLKTNMYRCYIIL